MAAEDAQKENVGLYMFIGAYMLAMVMVAWIAYRRKQRAVASGSEAVKAQYGGNFSPMLLILTTFSSVFSGYTVMGVPQEASLKGYLSLRWLPAIFSIIWGMLIYYPRIRRLSVERGYRSPNDFITDRFRSKALRGLCSLCTCVPQLFYLTVQVVSFAELLSGATFGAIPKIWGMVIFAVIVLAMEKIGGMHSVVLSDAVQSVFMVFGFLAILAVITAQFGTLSDMAPATCPTLGFVNQTALDLLQEAQDIDVAPPQCISGHELTNATECVAYGCIEASNPKFLENPGPADQAAFFFFLFNFLAFPLNPHMMQRTYIASSDSAVRLVTMALAPAAFLTMMPGIVAGITKATFAKSWPLVSQGAGVSAFSAIGNELKQLGPLEYGLVALLTCSAMAAIMSTADSVILGVSNALSVDIFEGIFAPAASQKAIVRFGTATSVVMMAFSILGGAFVSSAEFGAFLTLQNGILLQAVPAFLLGLFFEVSTQAIMAGILAGVSSFLLAWLVGNPLAALFVPHPNVGALVNFLVVLVAHPVSRRFCSGAEPFDSWGQSKFGDRLSTAKIRSIMTGTREPSKPLLVVLGLGLVAVVPFYGELGCPESLVGGYPLWAVIVFFVCIALFLLVLLTAVSWRPADRAAGAYGGGAEQRGDSEGLADAAGFSNGFEVSDECKVEYRKPAVDAPVHAAPEPDELDVQDVEINLPAYHSEHERREERPRSSARGAGAAASGLPATSIGQAAAAEDFADYTSSEEEAPSEDAAARNTFAARAARLAKLPFGALGYATTSAGGSSQLAGPGPHFVCCLFFRRVAAQ